MYEEWIEAVWAELRILVWSATTGESRQVSSADLATWIAAQSNPQQLLKMAYAAERHGLLHEAILAYRLAFVRANSAAPLKGLARLLVNSGNYGLAAEVLRELIRAEPREQRWKKMLEWCTDCPNEVMEDVIYILGQWCGGPERVWLRIEDFWVNPPKPPPEDLMRRRPYGPVLCLWRAANEEDETFLRRAEQLVAHLNAIIDEADDGGID
jgi:hypothetical protein